MSKGSGGTRAGTSGNPRGSSMPTSYDGWSFGPGSLGGIEAKKKGAAAEELYYAMSTPIERAVESLAGDIRTGGGFSGPQDDREYTIIFRDDAARSEITTYLKEMKTGAALYKKYQEAARSGSDAEYTKAEAALSRWYDRVEKR